VANVGIIQCPRQREKKLDSFKAVEHLFRTDSRLFHIFQLQGRSAIFSFRCDVPLRRIAIKLPRDEVRCGDKMPQNTRLSLIGRTTESLVVARQAEA
jgi:hypothetical protein